MRKMIKTKINLIVFMCVLFCFVSQVYAYSNEFEFMISTMEISPKNVHGMELNEEIYNKYSLLVYGKPENIKSGQRWKNVEDGRWNNNSNKGEYWILGENYEGYEVHNHRFPADIEPPTRPENWRYAVLSDAEESWQDQTKYMDDFQREYMLGTNLMRNNNIYNITARDIGLNKVRLENYATWKTMGTVYTQRYDISNKKWAANFMAPAMSADADLEGFATFPNGIVYNAINGESEVIIPIDYGSKAINLSEYAKEEHVKEIKSSLYINNQLIDECTNFETFEISDNTSFKAIKTYDGEVLMLYVEVRSLLYTKFTTDGALTDVQKYTLIVNFGNEEIDNYKPDEDTYNNHVINEEKATNEEVPPPVIKNIELKRLVNGQEQDLLVSNYTGDKFICAGQTIEIKITVANQVDKVDMHFEGDSSIFTFDDVTKLIEWDEPRKRGKDTFFSSLSKYKNMYKSAVRLKKDEEYGNNTDFVYTYIIPYGTKQTLNSWATLREQSKDAFSINERLLFSRIRNPYQLVFKASGFGGKTTKRISLDVFERWDSLYNRDISKYVENGEYGW